MKQTSNCFSLGNAFNKAARSPYVEVPIYLVDCHSFVNKYKAKLVVISETWLLFRVFKDYDEGDLAR
jgi:hypothetical protein